MPCTKRGDCLICLFMVNDSFLFAFWSACILEIFLSRDAVSGDSPSHLCLSLTLKQTAKQSWSRTRHILRPEHANSASLNPLNVTMMHWLKYGCALQLKCMQDNRDELRLGIPGFTPCSPVQNRRGVDGIHF